MIPAEFYKLIYIILVFFMTIPISIRYINYDNSLWPYRQYNKHVIKFITVFFILFIGFRPFSIVFGDMMEVVYAMKDHRYESIEIAFSENFLYVPFVATMSRLGFSSRLAVLAHVIVNFTLTYIALKKIFPKDLHLAMIVFLGAFSTFLYATNGIKAGCAMAIFLCAIAYQDKKWLCLLLLLATMGGHHGMQLPILVFIFCYFCKNTKVFVLFWLVCLALSIGHVTFFQELFARYTDEHAATVYLLANENDVGFVGSGFRFDFALYSVFPIVIYEIYVKNCKTISEYYIHILNTYIVTNAVWLLCMYANYSYRIAYLSWGIYPIVILYPFLSNNEISRSYRTAGIISLGMVAFTVLLYL